MWRNLLAARVNQADADTGNVRCEADQLLAKSNSENEVDRVGQRLPEGPETEDVLLDENQQDRRIDAHNAENERKMSRGAAVRVQTRECARTASATHDSSLAKDGKTPSDDS